MTKPKPKRTEHEQQFLDMACIHLMASLNTREQYPTNPGNYESNVITAHNQAELLLAERNRRL